MMLIDWVNIACYLYLPNIIILNEESIEEVSLDQEEFKLLKEILLKKILPYAEPVNGYLKIDKSRLTPKEFKFLKNALGEKILERNDSINMHRKTYSQAIKFHTPSLEITTKCNFNCPHCYLAEEHKTGTDMDLRTAISLIQTFKKYGAVGVNISGGEPALYDKDSLLKLLEHIKDQNLIAIYYTNASMITDEIAEKLSEMEAYVIASIYGFDKESYRKYTGFTEAYEGAVKSMKIFRDYGVPVTARIIYTKVHEEMGYDIKDFMNFVKKLEPTAIEIRTGFVDGWRSDIRISSISTKIPEIGQKELKPKKDKREEKFKRIGKRLYTKEYFKSCPRFGGQSLLTCGPYITVSGEVILCPYIDELIAHISNPKWPIIWNEKTSTNLPMEIKFRCSIKPLYLSLKPKI